MEWWIECSTEAFLHNRKLSNMKIHCALRSLSKTSDHYSPGGKMSRSVRLFSRLAVAGLVISLFADAGIGEAAPLTPSQQILNLPHPFYQGVSVLGMGGAAVATANDENAVFYNPAGLDNVTRWSFHLVNVEAQASTSLPSQIQTISGSTQNSNDVINAINTLNGIPSYAGVSDYTNFTMHDFAIGVVGSGQLVIDPAYPATTNNLGNAAAMGDAGLALGLAHGFFDHSLQIGVSAFVMQQYFGSVQQAQIPAGSTNNINLSKQLASGTGIGVAVNGGAIYHLDLPLNPTIGFSGWNIGTAAFGNGGTLPEMFNGGVGLSPEIGFGTLTVDADYDDLFNQTGWNSEDHIYAGVQYKFPEILGLSAGLYSGYPAVGVTLDFKLLKIDGAYYTQNGYGPFPADHIAALQIALGWD